VTTSPVTWEIQAHFLSVVILGQTHSRTADKRVLWGVSSESKRAVVLRYFSHRPRRIFRWREGGMQGKVELAEALGTTGVV
jgi:hypothetical protein